MGVKLKGPTMRRTIACALAAMALQGCAGGNETRGPSYLGAILDPTDEVVTPQPKGTPPAALQHVQSNKVLSAMAFQKVTGKQVAPERLKSGQ